MYSLFETVCVNPQKKLYEEYLRQSVGDQDMD